MTRVAFLLILFIYLPACVPPSAPSAEVQVSKIDPIHDEIPRGYTSVDGSRTLTFPADFGAHEDFSTEWWYYTGNLQTPEGRHFGFELTIFRVGLVSPTAEIPGDSAWFNRSLYFAHFAVSDIANKKFYAFERYSRPGPGLAGAQADPYRVWIEDLSIAESAPDTYHLRAAQADVALDLTLTDEMGVVLHGEGGFTRASENIGNAAYYYSQPRLRADGLIRVKDLQYSVHGLAWKDHEFSSGKLDNNQIGWDWFSLQFEEGPALMLYQLRERSGEISAFSSGTFISSDGTPKTMQKSDFKIKVLEHWRSPYTQGVYPAAWNIQLDNPNCLLEIRPWMADQEINFPTVTYWEGAVRFEGTCDGVPASGNGYVELTGYAGNLPLP
jgi:predicted secreted hydrolase